MHIKNTIKLTVIQTDLSSEKVQVQPYMQILECSVAMFLLTLYTYVLFGKLYENNCITIADMGLPDVNRSECEAYHIQT